MKFIVTRAVNGEWYWKLIARNGRVIGTSHDQYKNKGHAIRMTHRICNEMQGGIVVLVEE